MLVYYLKGKNKYMAIITGSFKIPDHQDDRYVIKIAGALTTEQAALLREEVIKAISNPSNVIYVDTKDVTDTDLSGINEIIHSHHQLSKSSKELVLLYQKNSAMEKWIATTSLDKFVSTAIVP